MSNKNPIRSLVVLLFLSGIGGSWSASAATYSYESPNYSTIVGSPGLTTSMNVTGSFELEPPLGQNLNNFDLTGLINQYSFNNGIDTFDQGNSVLCIAYVDTNLQGRITEYVISIRETPTPASGRPLKYLGLTNPGWAGADSGTAPSPGASRPLCRDPLSPNNRAFTAAGDYGTWTSLALPTPIPTLGISGLAILAGLMLVSMAFIRRRPVSAK